MYKNAVFQGQGIRSFAFIGGLKRFEKENIEFKSVSGVSGGSIVAALYAAGYKPQEIQEIFYDINIIQEFGLENDYQRLLQEGNKKGGKINLRKLLNLKKLLNPDDPDSVVRMFLEKGFASSAPIGDWISTLLREKGVTTFKDLEHLGKIDLTIIAADITKQEFLIFDKNTYPKLPISEAVECSICIPGFFRFKNIVNREITDGGILSRLPLFVFENELDNTVAFEISEEPERLKGFFAADLVNSYVNILHTVWIAHDTFLKDRTQFNNSLNVSISEEIHSVKFDLIRSEKEHLINQGIEAASHFLTIRNSKKYSKLQNFLKQQKWIEANKETGKILLNECQKNDGQWFQEGDFNKIFRNEDSRKVFDNLERMWMNSSDKKFGFRNQKEHWSNSGQPRLEISDWNNWYKFLAKVGWKSKGIPFIPFFPSITTIPLIPIKTPDKIKQEIEHPNFNLKTIEKGYLPNLLLLWFEISPQGAVENLLSNVKTFMEQGQLPLIELFEGLDP